MKTTIYFTSSIFSSSTVNPNERALDDVVKKKNDFINSKASEIKEIADERIEFNCVGNPTTYFIFATISLSFYGK